MGKARAAWMALKLLAVLLVVGLLCYTLERIGLRRIVAAARRTDPRSIALAAGLFLAVFWLWAFRWQQVIGRADRPALLRIFPIFMAGVFGNTITPGARMGGEPVRAYYMSKAFGGEKTRHLGVMLADKLGYSAVFFLFLAASVLYVVGFVPIPAIYKAVLGGLVLLIAAATASGFLLHKQVGVRSRVLGWLLPFLYHGRLLEFIRRRFRTYQQFERYAIRKMDNVLSPIGQAAGSPKALAKILTISVVSWVVFCWAHYVLFRALGADLDFARIVVIVTVSTFCGDVSVSPGGAGFMEAAMLALCAAFGVEQGVAAAAILMGRGIYYACSLGLGGLCFAVLAARYGRR